MAPPEWARYTHALPSIASAVGRTPLVRLNRITADVTPALYVKAEWYGAELVFTKGGESDVDLSLRKLGEIRAANPSRYWVPGQFDNPDNIEAHMLTTGPEVWEQMEGKVGAFVDSQGSGGLLTGVGRY